jgi:hypothetical protein
VSSNEKGFAEKQKSYKKYIEKMQRCTPQVSFDCYYF